MSDFGNQLAAALSGNEAFRNLPTGDGAVTVNGEHIMRGEEARRKDPREVLRDKYIEGVKVSENGSAITFLLEDLDPVTLTFPEEGRIRKVVWHGPKEAFQVEYADFAICQDGRARLYIATEDAGSLSYDKGTVIEVYMSGITRFTKLGCDEAEDHSDTVQAQQQLHRKWTGEDFHVGEFAELNILDPEDNAFALADYANQTDEELYDQGYGNFDPLDWDELDSNDPSDCPVDWADSDGMGDPAKEALQAIKDAEEAEKFAEEQAKDEADRDWHP